MFHFATPGDSPSPAEDELFRLLSDGADAPLDPLGRLSMLLMDASPHLIAVVLAAIIGFGSDERWAW
ncbi:hypothetical protein KDK95_14790 [Actinospica sp. MGRD01-02]|uniref:Uncharacterized protein n=1 Tax=Actinospica acidithermotolerans TaxID=2828514 RepID=A0A941EBU6_9ACTN|nr:hypothetical protein [Actinospica acidithermotolerans]MBR7827583.1 hypothetical protein [Actinospica acidithermotolerans]